ncbi:hypothetical protein PR001_g14046 [Phytophthora rubi]|uniref:Uncharacterized protein n=1 Tax=Phytophthora rubi TaxID=129364 RepID=A0A6A3LLB1_9STRA|nr:hypothetical protein PR001_g14046 [Phytophthora rubi]
MVQHSLAPGAVNGGSNIWLAASECLLGVLVDEDLPREEAEPSERRARKDGDELGFRLGTECLTTRSGLTVFEGLATLDDLVLAGLVLAALAGLAARAHGPMIIVSKVIDGEPYTKSSPASWPVTDRTEDEDPLWVDPSPTASDALSHSTVDWDWSEATVDAGRTGRPSRRGGITTTASNGESRDGVAAP